MSVDGFLAFLSLLLAAYAIMPKSNRLHLLWVVRKAEIYVGICILISILYLQFFEVMLKFGLTPRIGFRNSTGLTPQTLSYAMVVSYCLYASIMWRHRKLNRKAIVKFKDYIEELILEKNWVELSNVTLKNIKEIELFHTESDKSSKIRKFLKPRIIDSFSHIEVSQILKLTTASIQKGEALEIPEKPIWIKIQDTFTGILNYILIPFRRIVPDSTSAVVSSQELVSRIFLRENVVIGIATLNSQLVLEFLSRQFTQKRDFLEIYLKVLLADENSILYHEIRDIYEEGVTGRRFNFPSHVRLFKKLVMDADFAEKNQIWRPVGEYAISCLQMMSKKGPQLDVGNSPCDSLYERFRDPVQVSIFFFELLVTEAFYQENEWHMWLFYFTHFTDCILDNLNDFSNFGAEDHSRYHMLLSSICSIAEDWIRLIEEAKPKQKNASLRKIDAESENGNIPKSAIRCLTTILAKVSLCGNLSDEWKHEKLHSVYHLYFELVKKEQHDYAQVLSQSIMKGGIYIHGSNINSYQQILRNAWRTFDKIPYFTLGSAFDKFEILINS